MLHYLKLFILFLLSCFFLLPLLNIEDPIRTISLGLWGQVTDASIVEHICKPDRTYWYTYQVHGKEFRQRYDGYVEKLDRHIDENQRCKGVLTDAPTIKIKYFPFFSFWSEPLDHIEVSTLEKIMYIIIKVFGIIILLFTFFRK